MSELSPAKNRTEAGIMGLSKFFTGKPCKRGHLANRHVSNGTCVDCLTEKCAASSKEYRERKSKVKPVEGMPKTHAAAVEMGLTQYYTGEPCGRGHLSARRTSNKACLACQNLTRKAKRTGIMIEGVLGRGMLNAFTPHPVQIIGNPARITGVL